MFNKISRKEAKVLLTRYNDNKTLSCTYETRYKVSVKNYYWCLQTIPVMEKMVKEEKEKLLQAHAVKVPKNFVQCLSLQRKIDKVKPNLLATKNENYYEKKEVSHTTTNFLLCGSCIVPVPHTTYTTENVLKTRKVPDNEARQKAEKELKILNKQAQEMPNFKECIALNEKFNRAQEAFNIVKKRYDLVLQRKSDSLKDINESYDKANMALKQANIAYSILKESIRKFDKLNIQPLHEIKKVNLETKLPAFAKNKVLYDWMPSKVEKFGKPEEEYNYTEIYSDKYKRSNYEMLCERKSILDREYR